MKDLHERLRRQYRRRTIDFKYCDIPLYRTTNYVVLHQGQGPIFLSESAVCKDGSRIACAFPSTLYYISSAKSGYTFTEVSTGDEAVIGGLIHVKDERAISVGTRGTISSIFYGEPSHIEKTRWSFQAVSHVSISEKEFVAGDRSGRLHFLEHDEGRNIRLTRTVKGVHKNSISCIVVHDNVMVAVSHCRNASVWDLKSRRRVAMLPQSEEPIRAAINEHHIVTISWFEARVFRNEPGFRLRHVFKGLNLFAHLLCVYVAGDNLLLTAGAGPLITATNIDTKQPICRFTTSLSDITYLTLTPQGHVIAACYPFVAHPDSDFSGDYPDYDYCAVLKLSKSRHVFKELKKEARSRFGSAPKKRNWLLPTMIAMAGAIVSVAVRIIAKS